MSYKEAVRPLLPFPPVTRSHILKCSYHSWQPRFRSLTPKSRIIPLTDVFLEYLRADGIVLPPDEVAVPPQHETWHETPTTTLHSSNDAAMGGEGAAEANEDANSDSGLGTESDSTSSEADSNEDPSSSWLELHAQIAATIVELGGKVVPKLNWSAPRDATWMSTSNDMECRTANEVYLLLKSSDFVTHDLEMAFDGCESLSDGEEEEQGEEAMATKSDADAATASTATTTTTAMTTKIPYVLVLRKSFNLNPALEFRCFVRDQAMVAISQREMNYFPFLDELLPRLREKVVEFFHERLLTSDYFTGDIQSHHDEDDDIVNAITTINESTNNDNKPQTTSTSTQDKRPRRSQGQNKVGNETPMPSYVFDVYIPPPHDRVWLIDINPWAPRTDPLLFSWSELLDTASFPPPPPSSLSSSDSDSDAELDSDSEPGSKTPASTAVITTRQQQHSHHTNNPSPLPPPPQFRLIQRDDPEAYQFSSTKFSAHKLPRDVVDAAATMGSGGADGGDGETGAASELLRQWKMALERQDDEEE